MEPEIAIGQATDGEREWAARTMAGSEPWIRLGRELETCRDVCTRPGDEMWVARSAGEPLGFALVHARGVAGQAVRRPSRYATTSEAE